jgi:hypothetical protein
MKANLFQLVLWTATFCFVRLISAAPPGSVFTYQGFLAQNGVPANGVYDLEFHLRDAASGSNEVGTPVTLDNVFITNGLFSVNLDFGPGVFTGEPRWLGMAVRPGLSTGAFLPLPPTDLLTPAPYAYYASAAGSLPWTGLTGVPEGFADGVDNDTTYTAGPGLSLDTGQFQVVFGGSGLLNVAARSDHNHNGTYAPLVHSHNLADLTGTLPDDRLNGVYSQALDFNNAANQFTGAFSGSGASLANVDAVSLEGRDADGFWRTDGNLTLGLGPHFLGTTDNAPLEFKVNNQRALRLEPADGIPNVVGGSISNTVFLNVQGATIGGGGGTNGPPGNPIGPNRVGADFGVIAGGDGNFVNSMGGSIGGGEGNRIQSMAAYGVIPGGLSNEVSAPFGMAMGRGAQAIHQGAFVWADTSSPAEVSSTHADQFTVRAANGVRLTANAGTDKPVAVGERFRDNGIVAWARVNFGGDPAADFGVASVDHPNPGVYVVTLDAALQDALNLIPVATPLISTPPINAQSVRFIAVNQVGPSQFRVFINDGTFAPRDNAFTFMVTGR